MKQKVKKVVEIFLWGMLICCGMFFKVQAAAPPDIYVNGQNVIASPGVVPGVSYEAKTNTLTLSSVTITETAMHPGIEAFGDLNVRLIGESQITGKSANDIGIMVSGNLNISGTGTLTIDQCGFNGILVGNDICIKEATVNITAPTGISSTGKVTIDSGTVLIKATTEHAVSALNGFTVNGGSLIAASDVSNTIQIEEGDFLLTGGSVELNPANNVQPIYAKGAINIYGGKIKLSGNVSRRITLKNGTELSLGTGYWFSPDTQFELEVFNGKGSGKYRAGDTVTITADPSTKDKLFYCWVINSSEAGVHLQDPIKEETTFVMPAQNVTLTAEYVEVIKKNTVVTIGEEKYKIIGEAFSNPTVAYCGNSDAKEKTITIPNSVSWKHVEYKVITVSKNAFKNNKNLTMVNIGDNVTSIEKSAFENCKKLSKVTMGKKVTKIGANAFSGCKNLKTITVKSTKLKTIGKNAFRNIHKKAVIKVPKSKLGAYRKLFKNKGQKKTVKIKK
ncbi:MAG: leucine-rich repeat protein [Lachnospiraceae bacterium]|nr:leucine-rich repeat protein [Lachnospiraceae bacterium]